MSTVPPPRQGEPDTPGIEHQPEEPHFERMQLPADQRRLVKFILITVAVAVAWSVVALWVVSSH
ncbi:MAG: hypothetical protein IPJ14_10765 [Kineosporiaceae bacterium]|nr:hypothetical protein [Kineosporiaceae bacterium]MBK7623108.1 hypothetical protein [Kineosporiaceae bacterium]MBK8074941.1 hypothetical protein [Kineosporiaceae bacterium]